MGEFETVMQTIDFVSGLHNCREFSQPLEYIYQAMQTLEKSFFVLQKDAFQDTDFSRLKCQLKRKKVDTACL